MAAQAHHLGGHFHIKPEHKEKAMGFFAGELEVVLREHNPLPNESPWNVLNRLSIHPQQIERLQKAAEDIGQVATLPPNLMYQLRAELNLSPYSWARLEAGREADAFFRLLMYHNFSLEEAVNKGNSVFAASLKDRMATGGKSDSVYVSTPELDLIAAMPAPARRRGRKSKETLRQEAEAARQRIAEAAPDLIEKIAEDAPERGTKPLRLK